MNTNNAYGTSTAEIATTGSIVYMELMIVMTMSFVTDTDDIYAAIFIWNFQQWSSIAHLAILSCVHMYIYIPLPDVQSYINNVMYTGETSNVVTDLCCKELEWSCKHVLIFKVCSSKSTCEHSVVCVCMYLVFCYLDIQHSTNESVMCNSGVHTL